MSTPKQHIVINPLHRWSAIWKGQSNKFSQHWYPGTQQSPLHSPIQPLANMTYFVCWYNWRQPNSTYRSNWSANPTCSSDSLLMEPPEITPAFPLDLWYMLDRDPVHLSRSVLQYLAVTHRNCWTGCNTHLSCQPLSYEPQLFELLFVWPSEHFHMQKSFYGC